MPDAFQMLYRPGGIPSIRLVPPKKRRRSPIPRDSQRARVYKWEKALMRRYNKIDEPIARADITKLVHRMSMACGVRTPNLSYRNGTGSANANASRIRFNTLTPPPWMVAHEFAHVALRQKYGPSKYAGHGPEYVSIYIYLLERYVGIPANEARKSAEEFGVKHGKAWHP